MDWHHPMRALPPTYRSCPHNRTCEEISGRIDDGLAVLRFNACTALNKRKSERVGTQNELPRAVVEAGTSSCFLLSKKEAVRPIRSRQASKHRLGDPGSTRINDTD